VERSADEHRREKPERQADEPESEGLDRRCGSTRFWALRVVSVPAAGQERTASIATSR
jgi:hypothetical protein